MPTSPDADFKSEIGIGLKAREKLVEGMLTSVCDRTSTVLKPAGEMPTFVLFRRIEYFFEADRQFADFQILKLTEGMLTSVVSAAFSTVLKPTDGLPTSGF